MEAPAIEGWFTGSGEDFALLGTRCSVCGTVSFPPGRSFCPNPACDGSGDALETMPLSGRGRLWSWTVNHYAPPPPYLAPEPFVPYTVAAVELTEERMVILGQLAPAVDPGALEIGMEMELVPGRLEAGPDDDDPLVMWNWRPA